MKWGERDRVAIARIMMGLAIAMLMAMATGVAQAEELRMLYFDRPPFYVTQQGKPGGLVLDPLAAVFEQADIQPLWLAMPPNRILYELREHPTPQCAPGWFATDERRQWAVFSEPIWRDGPMVALVHPARAVQVQRAGSLAAVLDDPDLALGFISGFSMGESIDRMIAARERKISRLSGSQLQLARMIASGRLDLTLVQIEEAALLATDAGGPVEIVPLSDLPPGRQRYLMCSQSVPDHVLEQINHAIRTQIGAR